MAVMRRVRSDLSARPILLRVRMQPVSHGAKRAGTCRCWVSLGYGSWVAIASRFDWVAPAGIEMKASLISFAVGLGVGVIYALVRVKSPVPPRVIALLGLLGMVFGEQIEIWIQARKL